MVSTTKDQVDLEDLAQRVQDLPAELYDMVLEYTFTAGRERIEITPAYKPPPQLQVSRTTRDLFAKHYYTRARFFAPVWKTIKAFVRSLSIAHIIMLSGEEVPDPEDDDLLTRNEWRARMRLSLYGYSLIPSGEHGWSST